MNYKSILSLIVGLVFAAQAESQSSIDVKFWSLLSLKVDKGFQDVTDKYDGYESSSILFNKDVVKINIFKTQSCAIGMSCAQKQRVPDTIVKLQVRKVVSNGCYDSYYASTEDNIKSSLYEQVIVNRFANERCHSVLNIRDGYIHFKVTGPSKSSGELASAHAYATMLNVKVIVQTSLPASARP